VKEIEELLRRDRAAGIPDPPDVSFTVAAVKRRLAQQPQVQERADDWTLVLAAAALFAGAASTAVLLGLHPAWLLLVPLAALTLFPILLGRGA
jgi:fatty acid desaturase